MPGPGKHGPAEVFVLYDGYDLTAESLNDVSLTEEAETAETTGFGVGFREHTPIGMAKCELVLGGAIYDTCSAKSHDQFSTGLMSSDGVNPQAEAKLAVIGPAGSSVGAPCEAFEGSHRVKYSVIASLDDLLRANATYLMTGARDSGVVIHPLGEETTDNNTQSTAFDAGSCSTEGGVAHLQITAFDGDWDSLTVVVQDSSDDGTYGTLIPFAATSTTTPTGTALRGTVDGEVQRYIASAWTFAGAGTSGAATFLTMFSRNSTF